ncbi:MAG: hypothetical protein FJ042_07905 [Candidatus Cloacimonetes bacterium]|nr:hypothetical protein [Candidatus Cloacimonadota bacterium]
MRQYILVFLCLSTICGIAARNDSQNLRQELERWQNFRCDGILQVNYGQLSLRNNFVMVKQGMEMRLDLIGGGAWGGSGGALISVYYGDYFSVRSPIMPKLQDVDYDRYISNLPPHLIPDLDTLMDLYGPEIISKRKTVIDSVELHFNKNMQLKRVFEPRSNSEVIIKYNRHGEPDIVTIKTQGKTVAVMEIDEIRFGQFPIEPLPPLFRGPFNPIQEVPEDPDPPLPDAE